MGSVKHDRKQAEHLIIDLLGELQSPNDAAKGFKPYVLFWEATSPHTGIRIAEFGYQSASGGVSAMQCEDAGLLMMALLERYVLNQFENIPEEAQCEERQRFIELWSIK